MLAVTFFVVFVERGQRRITVNYARRQGGRSAYMNQTSFLPLKLNMSGVIPPIFAVEPDHVPGDGLDLVRPGASSARLAAEASAQALSPGEPLHMILYAALIIGFAFFYTALVFNSQETADNLKKSGALIPGIRPGKATADYIDGVLTRLTAAGAVYLVLVCLLPEIMRTKLGTSFYFGGTSLLIVVVVVMDFIAQIQAHLMSHQYESLLKKANLKGGSRGLPAADRQAARRRRPAQVAGTDGRLARRSRARVGQDHSARQSSARGRAGRVRRAVRPVRIRRRSMGTLPMPGSGRFGRRGFQVTRDPVKISSSLRRAQHPAANQFGESRHGAYCGRQPACPEARLGRVAKHLRHRPYPFEEGLRSRRRHVRRPRSATCPSRKSSACAPKSASSWSRATCAAKSAWRSSA